MTTFLAIAGRSSAWHVFEEATLKSLCGKNQLATKPEGKTVLPDGQAWAKGQDCKPCWVAAGYPVGDGKRGST